MGSTLKEKNLLQEEQILFLQELIPVTQLTGAPLGLWDLNLGTEVRVSFPTMLSFIDI